MGIKHFVITLIGMLSQAGPVYAGDTSGALLRCSGPAGKSISIDYSYLDIKDHTLTVRIPGMSDANATLRQLWNDGNQLMFAVRLDQPNRTTFLEFISHSRSVDHYGHTLFDGRLDLGNYTDVGNKVTPMRCKEIDGGGSW